MEDLFEFIQSEYKDGEKLYVWIIGQFAAGKTTTSHKLENLLDNKYKVRIYPGGKYFLQTLNDDKDFKWHSGNYLPTGEDEITITSGQFDIERRKSLMRDLINFNGEICLIEEAVSIDSLGIRNQTFNDLLKLIPSAIFNKSVFVYLDCSFNKRLERNEGRGGLGVNMDYRKVNSEVFLRLSRQDDFKKEAIALKRPYKIFKS